MNQKRFISIIFIVIVILLAGIVGYLTLVKKSLSPTNESKFVGEIGAKDCGIEQDAFENWEMRQCILDAFNSCTPAYARSKEEGVSWEASGWDRFIEVKSVESNKCVLSYRAEGANFIGPYKHNGSCHTITKSVGAKDEKGNIWYVLRLSNCEGINNYVDF